MDPALVKAATDITEKVAGTVAPTIAKKVLEWISNPKARAAKQRGEWERRHTTAERRVSPVKYRLAYGTWLGYHRQTGKGMTEPIERLSVQTRGHLMKAFLSEAKNFSFAEKSSDAMVAPSTFVEQAIDLIWGQWKNKPVRAREGMLIVEAISEYVDSKYIVRRIERRQAQRRSKAAG